MKTLRSARGTVAWTGVLVLVGLALLAGEVLYQLGYARGRRAQQDDLRTETEAANAQTQKLREQVWEAHQAIENFRAYLRAQGLPGPEEGPHD